MLVSTNIRNKIRLNSLLFSGLNKQRKHTIEYSWLNTKDLIKLRLNSIIKMIAKHKTISQSGLALKAFQLLYNHQPTQQTKLLKQS